MSSLAVDAALTVDDPRAAGELARALEQAGFDGAYTFEGRHDPFLPLAFAAQATERLRLATGIAIGFARSPMLLANLGYDLQLAARGRFALGLGSQIKPHIEKRFGCAWSEPAARMRELVQAVRAILACWHEGTPLDFRGRFYTHTLMTPMFDPGPHPHGLPPIVVAGVGPHMIETAGEVGDGLLVHPLNTPAFIAHDVLPALARGRERAGRAHDAVALNCQLIVATGMDAAEVARNRELARAQVAFYASTPAYRVVLERHGWGDLQPRLNALSKQGAWQEMTQLVSEDLVREVVVSGEAYEAGVQVRARCAAWCTRVSPTFYGASPAVHERFLRGVRAA